MYLFNAQKFLIIKNVKYVTPETIISEDRHFIVMISTQSGNEAVLWDLLTDTNITPVLPITEIKERLLVLKTYSNSIEAVYPKTDNHIWSVINPNDTHDSPIILPNYISGFYDLSLGYEGNNNSLSVRYYLGCSW